jgi:hypothetical protein
MHTRANSFEIGSINDLKVYIPKNQFPQAKF